MAAPLLCGYRIPVSQRPLLLQLMIQKISRLLSIFSRTVEKMLSFCFCVSRSVIGSRTLFLS